ncbi:nuclear transport factor 2 family protein [Bradyrhizobium tropiciagri]|nr:nuclear transport factor 2 family protein [Bradyrhizobium tropiciagri]
MRELYEEYFACLEAQDLTAWPSFFTEDAVYLVQSDQSHRSGLLIGDIYCDGIAMFRDRAAATANTSVHARQTIRHFPGALKLAARKGDLVSSTMSYLAVRSVTDEAPTFFSVGRSIDEIAVNGDRLRFARRTVIYDHDRIDNSLVFPL